MTTTIDINTQLVENIFSQANVRFFQNLLPTPSFEITNTRKQLGQFRGCVGRKPVIKISKYYKVSRNDVETTVIHEMIHLWQFVVYGSSNHGMTFIKKANEIRMLSGNEYNITRTSSRKGYEIQDTSNMKNRIYAVFQETNASGYGIDTEFAWVVALSAPMYNKIARTICTQDWKLDWNLNLIGFVYDRYEPDFDRLPAMKGTFRRSIRGKRMTWNQFCDKYHDFVCNITKKLK